MGASPGGCSLSEYAWAAGFFDGEGHTAGGDHGVAILVTQKFIDPLMRFQAAAGGLGRITWNNDKWLYRASGLSTVQNVLGNLWPYLGEIKREQALNAVLRFAAAPRTHFAYTGIGARRGG